MKISLESDEDWSSGVPSFVFSMSANDPQTFSNSTNGGSTEEPPEKRVKTDQAKQKPNETRLKILAELFHETKDKLKCAVCLRMPRPGEQLFNCRPDQNLCRVCHNDSCRFVAHHRSVLVETLLLKLPYQCKNVGRGCQELFFKEDLLDHEVKCDFVEVHCVDFECQVKLGYNNYDDHFMVRHYDCQTIKYGSFQDKEFNDIIALLMKKPTRLDVFGFSFFETGAFKEGHVYRWISMLAPKEKSTNFSVVIKISDKNGNDIKRKMNVHSMNENPTDIVKNEKDVFVFSTKTADSWSSGAVFYSVEILHDIVKIEL